METTSICWLAVFVLLIVIELATMGLTTIWFAGGAVAGFIASMLGANVVIQAVVFFVVSIVLLIFTRPFAVRYINSNKTKTNIDGLIGQEALVLEEINNIRETGCARLEGKEWTARSVDDSVLPADTVVIVERIEGVKLIVKTK
ncbi:MAG: NfeD family protein [Lachnospiraceae bacterium]